MKRGVVISIIGMISIPMVYADGSAGLILPAVILVAILAVALWFGRNLLYKQGLARRAKEHEELRERSSIRQMRLGVRR